MAGWDKKREVMRNYDRSAAVYDAQYAEEQNAKIKAALNHLNLEEDNLILDVGCGTGLLFEHIGESVKLLVGLDISSKILEKAKRYAKRFPNVNIIRADADLMPFPKEVFDAVFAITLLQNTPNPNLTLQEMKRVGKHPSIIVVTGLRKEFSQKTFRKLLLKAGLGAFIMESGEQLKEYVAVCKYGLSE